MPLALEPAVDAEIPTLTRPLLLWHLLSLDAPTVATLWTLCIARTAHVTLAPASLPAMFLAVWILYATDRLLDARILDPHVLDARPLDTLPQTTHPTLEARHLFHHHHRRRFQAALVLAAVALLPLILQLPAAVLRLDLIAGAALLAWLLLIHATPRSHRLPKELAVGVFFSAATFIPTVARAPALRPTLAPAALLFAALCSLNCLYIYAWEHPRPSPSTHLTTRVAIRNLTPITLALLATSLLLALLDRPAAPLLLASALSAALLFALHRTRLAPSVLRPAADLALLTPALLLPFLR